MRSTPPWAGAAAAPSFPPLRESARTGVVIVGGGITGLLTALLLARHGIPVTVLEQGMLGGGESGRSTGHLTTALDLGYRALERRRGAAASRLAAESQCAAMELLAGLCASHGIACGLETVDGFLLGKSGLDPDLDEEAEAAKRAGLIDVERLGRVPGELFGLQGCLRYPRQGQLDPARLTLGLTHALERLGGRLYSGTRALSIEGGSPVTIHCAGGSRVTAEAAVIAAHEVLGELPASSRPVPHRTYVLAAPLPARSVPRAIYWDCERAYHYVRVFNAGEGLWPQERREYLVVGGEDHLTGRGEESAAPYDRLETWMRAHFPMARAISHRWSGQILEPSDGLPSVGRDPRRANVFFATGFSGSGMTHSAAAAMVLSDLVQGRPNPWAGLFDPARLGLRASVVAREGLRIARSLTAWLAPAEAGVARGLAAGMGAVVRRGVRAVALYRDEAGRLHRFSAACKHRGCVVRWNCAERSWDCPCHGSRYDGLGRVVNGPAVEGLKPLTDLDHPQ